MLGLTAGGAEVFIMARWEEGDNPFLQCHAKGFLRGRASPENRRHKLWLDHWTSLIALSGRYKGHIPSLLRALGQRASSFLTGAYTWSFTIHFLPAAWGGFEIQGSESSFQLHQTEPQFSHWEITTNSCLA
jgi:hypothetical protein